MSTIYNLSDSKSQPEQHPKEPTNYQVDQVNGELLVLIKVSAELSDLPVNLRVTWRAFQNIPILKNLCVT